MAASQKRETAAPAVSTKPHKHRSKPTPAPIDKHTAGLDLVFAFCQAHDRGALAQPGPRELAMLEELRCRLLLCIGPDGISADKALRLTLRRGRKSEIDLHVRLANLVLLKMERDGLPRESAIDAVASTMNKSADTVRHAYEQYRPILLRMRALGFVSPDNSG